jgi:hypothetical protein
MGLFETAKRIANLCFQIDLDESCYAWLRAVRIRFFRQIRLKGCCQSTPLLPGA